MQLWHRFFSQKTFGKQRVWYFIHTIYLSPCIAELVQCDGLRSQTFRVRVGRVADYGVRGFGSELAEWRTAESDVSGQSWQSDGLRSQRFRVRVGRVTDYGVRRFGSELAEWRTAESEVSGQSWQSDGLRSQRFLVRVGRVTVCGGHGFKIPCSIFTSKTGTSSLSRLVRDGGDPLTVCAVKREELV